MKTLPSGLKPYRRTETFTANTVPAGLLRDHKTKAGVWGVIHITRGSVRYRISTTGDTFKLTPETCGIVEPEVLHSVTLTEDAEFYVEFWR